ncbi:MAG: bifunctional metallophosphatase/5'-nucleotidase [Phocaeicola sp.]
MIFTFINLFVLLAMNLGVFTANDNQQEVKIKLIETSDVHGNFFPYDFINRKELSGGLSRVSSYVKEQRKIYGDNCILFDNGDMLQGQPSVYYYNFIDTVSTHIAAATMNYMKYDLGNMGNHDIETGHAVYDRWVEQCNFPILGANSVYKDSQDPYFKPYVVFNKGGVKIAVLGLITPAIPCWLPEQLWSGMEFKDMEATAAYWVKIIEEKEKPDFLIGAFHAGKSGSVLNGIPENPSLEVAKKVPGFDAVFIGHDHTLAKMSFTNVAGKKVWLLDPGFNANFVSSATLHATLKGGKVVKKSIECENIDMSKYPVDTDYMAHFDEQYQASLRFVSHKIGNISHTVSTRDAYFGSSEFIDLIHQLQLEITGAEISLTAPLSFDAQIKKGNILISDMFNLYKYENMLYVMKLTGKEIKGLLELSYAQWSNHMKSPEDNLLLFKQPLHGSKKPKLENLSFNFDSAAGINYVVDVTKPIGERITILTTSAGVAFDESKFYKVAVNSYRGNGGGDLLTTGAGIPSEELPNRIISSTDKDLRYYLIQHIQKLGTVIPSKFNNWSFIPEEWTISAAKRDYKLLFGEEKK